MYHVVNKLPAVHVKTYNDSIHRHVRDATKETFYDVTNAQAESGWWNDDVTMNEHLFRLFKHLKFSFQKYRWTKNSLELRSYLFELVTHEKY